MGGLRCSPRQRKPCEARAFGRRFRKGFGSVKVGVLKIFNPPLDASTDAFKSMAEAHSRASNLVTFSCASKRRIVTATLDFTTLLQAWVGPDHLPGLLSDAP
jgi:hypothetical protein